MTAVLTYLIAFIVLISVITIIHESGHFFAARICRVKVLDFSIGMGPSILQKQDRHQTNYNIRILPIGGFVQMLGEGENSYEKDSFQSKPYHQRLFIVLAGPMANFILAFIIFAGLKLEIFYGQAQKNLKKDQKKIVFLFQRYKQDCLF